MMELREKTVTQIVQENYKTAAVFKQHGISYCCGGNLSLEEACQSATVNLENLLSELELATRPLSISNRIPFQDWKLGFLIDFITHVHHGYLKITLPELETTLLGFYDGHQKKYPFMREVLETYQEIHDTIQQHTLQEEDVIFPYIKQIEAVHNNKEPYGQLFVRTLSKPLNKLETGSSNLEELLSKMTELTNHFRIPEKACPKMQVIYRQLQELHQDLENHKYLETKVLLPKAAQIELDLLHN